MMMLAVIVVMLLVLMRFYGWMHLEPTKNIHGNAEIIKVEHMQYQDRLTIKINWMHMHIYTTKDYYQTGQTIVIKGEVKTYKKQTIPHGFNPYQYYLSQNIKGYIDYPEITVIKSQHFSVVPREKLKAHLDTYESHVYLKSLILGIYEFPKETKQLYQGLGIWFLLSFSGIHLYVLINIVKKIMFYFNVNLTLQQLIIIVFYGIILYCHDGSWVVWRLCLIYGLGQLNYDKNFNLSQLERVLIVWILMMLFKVHLLYHLGFLIVLIIISFLALFKQRINHYPYVIQGYYRSFLITAICLPFIGYLSFPMILMIPFVITFFSYVIMPLSVMALFLKPLDHIFYRMIHLFEGFLSYIAHQSFEVVFPKINLMLSSIYLVCLVFFIVTPKVKRKLVFLLLGLLAICVPFINLKYSEGYVMFLDVGQGDTTLIVYGTCVIVIDAYDHVLSYLNHKGIKNISYLVLTHNHNDHVAEAPLLINKINVERVIINPYDSYALYHPFMHKLASGDDFSCGAIRFYVLGPTRSHLNTNNNSLVIQFVFDGKTFLMTGDTEFDAEMDLVKTHGHRLKSDVLKVGHHGSKSSSHSVFLDHVQPEIAIISLKSGNRHHFPHSEVLERLKKHNSIIYQTNQMGSIIYKEKNKKEKWVFVLPF
jgi:competence protein ComEC